LKFLFLVSLTRKGLDHTNAGERFLHRYLHLRHAFLFVLHRLSRASSINAKRQQTCWKENQRDQGKLPIHHHEHTDCSDDGDRLLENIAADCAQSHLHDAGIVRDNRHQKSRARLVKEVHRVAEHLAEKLIPDIAHHLVTHPLHAVGASVGTEAAHHHNRWDSETDQDD